MPVKSQLSVMHALWGFRMLSNCNVMIMFATLLRVSNYILELKLALSVAPVTVADVME